MLSAPLAKTELRQIDAGNPCERVEGDLANNAYHLVVSTDFGQLIVSEDGAPCTLPSRLRRFGAQGLAHAGAEREARGAA